MWLREEKESEVREFTFLFNIDKTAKIVSSSAHNNVLSPTDPWLRSRPPMRPYLSQGPISVQPRDARATANPFYRRGLAVASGGPTEVHYGKSVRPRHSLVGSPRFESRTPFHGWTTPSEGRRTVENGGVLPPGDGG